MPECDNMWQYMSHKIKRIASKYSLTSLLNTFMKRVYIACKRLGLSDFPWIELMVIAPLTSRPSKSAQTTKDLSSSASFSHFDSSPKADLGTWNVPYAKIFSSFKWLEMLSWCLCPNGLTILFKESQSRRWELVHIKADVWAHVHTLLLILCVPQSPSLHGAIWDNWRVGERGRYSAIQSRDLCTLTKVWSINSYCLGS